MECPLHDDRLTLAGLFFEAHAGVSRELEHRLAAECGLTISAFEVLLRLARSDDHRLRMTDLAAQVTLSTSGLTRAVDRLVEGGLVTREACESDRRVLYAALTPAGLERIDAAVRAHLTHLDEVFTGLLDDGQRAALGEALRILRDNLNPCATVGTATPRSPTAAPARPAR